MAISTHPTRSCSPVPMATVVPFLAKITEFEVTPASTAHAKRKSSSSFFCRLSCANFQTLFCSCFCWKKSEFEWIRFLNAFLNYQASVRQAFDIKNRWSQEFFKPAQSRQFQNSEIFLAFRISTVPSSYEGGSNYLKIICRQDLGAILINGAIDDYSASESRNAIWPEGVIQGCKNAAFLMCYPGCAAWIIMRW